MIEKKIPMALIMEDDANLRYDENMHERIVSIFKEIKERGIEWDLFYLGRGTGEYRRKLTPHLVTPQEHQGLFCYMLTLRGARILVRASHPYRIPVDVLAARVADGGQLKAIALTPSLCYVVPVRSDTGHIV